MFANFALLTIFQASTAISTSLFYSVPKERLKRFVHANLLDVNDTNESDFSAERSEDEVSGEAVSTEVEEAEAEVASLTDVQEIGNHVK